MKGWKEEEIRNKNLMAPCGLYCGACGIYIATRDNNDKFKKILGDLYGSKPEHTECLGCMQPELLEKLYGFCRVCTMRDCVREKGYYSCHQCADWPCEKVEKFGLATGRRVMKRAIPLWRKKVRELGDQQGSVEWARSELERYHCPSCGEPLFRGARQCRSCKEALADRLDGTIPAPGTGVG
ncbi:MAG: hypothetical protein A2176_07010 [Spirochaetes bacterium RBG_13_51_14]|nr:MAG: hypothetical protein A2176_07010 [Spirochaetes bacterium RBG_13_51_14]